ncbi:DnaJ domain-containing protein, partial [Dolichospermum sp. ST_sed1]|nr:DnaJ domain-containing protein [Dolichospermum sp. ST_sed1]
LLQKSEHFWQYQSALAIEKNKKTKSSNDFADQIREEFKQRREQQRQNISQALKFNLESDYLRFMGFSSVPSLSELKKRYILLAKKMHPDAGGDAQAFQKLAEAYKHLENKYSFKME